MALIRYGKERVAMSNDFIISKLSEGDREWWDHLKGKATRNCSVQAHVSLKQRKIKDIILQAAEDIKRVREREE